MTLRLGLLGHPVAHSLSPALARGAFQALGLQGRYELLDTPAPGPPPTWATGEPAPAPTSALDGRLDALRRGLFHGLNVTAPLKTAALTRCDELSEDARRVGAVNTLCRAAPGGDVEVAPAHLVGHNTDLPGLTTALRERWPATPWRGRPAAVLGAGGAARAAVWAAALTGASEVRVFNRTLERAEALATFASQAPVPVRAAPWPGPGAAHGPGDIAGCALILQATSVGVGLCPAGPHVGWDDALLVAQAALATASPGACLYDLVYTPAETVWVRAARSQGLMATSGLGMLVHQAVHAYALWTGRRPPAVALWAAAREALRR